MRMEEKATTTATSTNNSCPSAAIASSNTGDAKSRRLRRTEKRPVNGRTGQVGGTGQRKRRRGKTKRNRRSNNQKSVNWHLPIVPGYPLVPYNTNRFLMEYHMPEVEQRGDIGRDGEEFLTHEFSAVYETAKCERLESLTKQQLVQEYLQLEANYDQLSQRLKTEAKGRSGSSHSHVQFKWEAQVRALKEKLRRVTSENRALKAQIRVPPSQVQPPPSLTTTTVHEEDSESDSSFSSISTISGSSPSSSASASSSSSSSSGSCCSSRCSSRDSRGNVLPQLLAMGENAEEAPALMNDDEGGAEDVVMQERPYNNHHRHRTHRQRRNSRLMHQSRQRQDAEEQGQQESQPAPAASSADLVVVENGHGEE